MTTENISLTIKDNGVAIMRLDVQGEKMNPLSLSLMDDFLPVLDQIASDNAIKAVIVTGNDNAFVAGADLNMVLAATKAEEGSAMAAAAHKAFDMISNSKKPYVAAINGAALGGGYELAAACHARVANNDSKTVVGLPEVQLGLLPAGGGTQRLPRLIGLPKALDIMLTGKNVRPKQAKRMGMVDEVVPNEVLLLAAEKRALALTKRKDKAPLWKTALSYCNVKGITKLALEKNPLGRNFVFKKALEGVMKKTQGNYPAPEGIIDCVKTGLMFGYKAGAKKEIETFGKLVASPESKALINIFFASNELKKTQYVKAKSRPVNKVGVIGGGLMGSGIASVSVEKAKAQVRIKDISEEGIRKSLAHVAGNLNKKVKRRYVTPAARDFTLSCLSGSVDYQGFQNVDLVIEAVFEKLELKHQILKEVEKNTHKDTIFATNTSSLKVGDIAEAAKAPTRVIGMHYFSPVEKMPLLEIIVTEKTASWVTATAVEFGRKQGKTVIVVKDGAGFYVNRILFPYMNEAGRLLMEGVPVDLIDETMLKFGFPVGPFKLLDEVGLDIGSKIQPNLEAQFGERMLSAGAVEQLIDDNRLGKKSGKGFYLYNQKEKGVDETVYSKLGVSGKHELAAEEIIQRCIYLLLNEAAMCVEDETVSSPRDADIGAIFGIGFAPFLGGPLRYIDTLGVPNVVNTLNDLADKHGERYKPAKILLDMASEGKTFY